jgi:hypothetical protein
MKRRFLATALALAGAVPAFANTTQLPARPVPSDQPALRLMNDREFSAFLAQLDTALVRAQRQLKKMDVATLSRDSEEKQELERSYTRCLQSLENTRDEIQKLQQKQTLKLDLFLLIDLNELARNLDVLDETLMSPASLNGAGAGQRCLDYAREVLSIDGSLGSQITAFQHHFIAFTGVVDASMQQNDADASDNPAQK